MQKLVVLGSSLLVILLAVGCQVPTGDVGTATDALDRAAAPGSNFNLSGYNLQLPVTSGSGVLTISQPQLNTYSSDYFYTDAAGAMVFYCPANGGTTSGSHYPRSELRKTAEWKMSSSTSHTLSATVAVKVQSSTKEIIIGQIHGNSTGSEALKIRWSNGSIVAGYKTKLGATEVKSTLISGLGLNTSFTYKIVATGHTVKVSANGTTKTITYDSSWNNESLYFKAGNYLQDDSGTDYSRVAFSSLSAN